MLVYDKNNILNLSVKIYNNFTNFNYSRINFSHFYIYIRRNHSISVINYDPEFVNLIYSSALPEIPSSFDFPKPTRVQIAMQLYALPRNYTSARCITETAITPIRCNSHLHCPHGRLPQRRPSQSHGRAIVVFIKPPSAPPYHNAIIQYRSGTPLYTHMHAHVHSFSTL